MKCSVLCLFGLLVAVSEQQPNINSQFDRTLCSWTKKETRSETGQCEQCLHSTGPLCPLQLTLCKPCTTTTNPVHNTHTLPIPNHTHKPPVPVPKSTVFTPPKTKSTAEPVSTPKDNDVGDKDEAEDSGMSLPVLMLIVALGGLVLLLLIIVVLCCCCRRHKKQTTSTTAPSDSLRAPFVPLMAEEPPDKYDVTQNTLSQRSPTRNTQPLATSPSASGSSPSKQSTQDMTLSKSARNDVTQPMTRSERQPIQEIDPETQTQLPSSPDSWQDQELLPQFQQPALQPEEPSFSGSTGSGTGSISGSLTSATTSESQQSEYVFNVKVGAGQGQGQGY